MQDPKVSIISVFYNREDTVEKSVRSLIEQTYKNLEIILIDDNSTDGTLSQLERFCECDPRVKVIHNQYNKGFTVSLIDTIQSLDAKYIAIHGSGDISLPERVSKQVDFLEKNIHVGVVTVGITNRPVNNVFNEAHEITLKHLFARNMINHGAVMYSRAKYQAAGGYNPFFKTRQDKDLWYRMALVTKIYFLPEKLYTWIKQENSISTNSFKNPQPSLLSEYAKFLAELRSDSKKTINSDDERTTSLLFNPKRCLRLFYKELFYNIGKKQYEYALRNIDLILIIEDRWFRRTGLFLAKAILNKCT